MKHVEKEGKENDADAVVDERFTGDRRLDVARDVGRFEDPEDSDRIGGGDESPEEEAVDQRQIMPDQPEHPLATAADDQGGERRADDREEADQRASLVSRAGSTWSAPAKRSTDNIPSMSTSVKSIEASSASS